MFIQCQHCQSTYQIDEHKIPEQNAFVRCAKCSTPIPLDIKEQSALTLKQPKKIVSCENCGTPYSIPLEKFNQDAISVRCGKCSHVFSVKKTETEGDEDLPYSDDVDGFDVDDQADDVDLNSISIPEENEIEVDSLFDNMDESEDENSDDLNDDYFDMDEFSDDESQAEDTSNDTTKDYLDSVSLEAESDDDELVIDNDDEFELSDISNEDQSKLFLSSDSDDLHNVEPDEDWPEIQDETTISGEDTEPSEFAEFDELANLSDSGDEDSDDPLELRRVDEKGGLNKTALIIIISLLILVTAGAGGWYFYKNQGAKHTSPTQAERFSESSKLAILEPLNGKLVENWETGKKVFILDGKVINNDTTGNTIRWIQVKGALYDEKQAIISEATGIVGKSLSASQIEDWSEGRLRSYIEELSQVPGPDLKMAAGQVKPFQIIFFDVPQNIQKLEARISQFSKNKTP